MARAGNVVKLKTEDIKTITEAEFHKLVKKCSAERADMETARSTLGGYISEACSNKHLHKGAFGIRQRLDRMDSTKRAELWYHLMRYVGWSGWDLTDLFQDRAQAAE